MSEMNPDLQRREFLMALGALGIAGAGLGPSATIVRAAERSATTTKRLVQHADHFGIEAQSSLSIPVPAEAPYAAAGLLQHCQGLSPSK